MQQWFGVRCVFTDGLGSFEERITVWPATSFDDAVAKAEAEALDYADDEGLQYLDFAQAYVLPEPPGPGAEVFSLTRSSDLEPDAYLDAFFDTGDEDEATLDVDEEPDEDDEPDELEELEELDELEDVDATPDEAPDGTEAVDERPADSLGPER